MSAKAREIAVKILYEINEEDAYSNISISRNLNNRLSILDEALIRELVYGVIENKLFIDWIIKNFSRVKFNRISPIVKEILRTGIYQIIFMDKIPDGVAVYESVKLSKKLSHKGVYGFVNGLLRNVVRKKDSIKLPDKLKNPIDYLSIKYSHPEWMIKRWIREYGYEFTEKLCSANNMKPKLIIRANTLITNREELMKILSEKGFDVEETKYAEDGIIINNPIRITDTDEFKKGLFQIQDESSMLVAQVLDPKEESLVIDVCSAPGGKTTHIAQKMKNKGKIIARDIYEHKLRLVKENAERLGIKIIETEKFDALELDEGLIGKADYCLVDAPCSGLGLIRRKPDIKWKKKEDNIKEIAALQYRILLNSSKYLKRNGMLVYSTCTIEKEENIRLINRFLEENKEFRLKSFSNLLKNCKEMPDSKNGYIEIYPNIYDMDGFFIAKMVKI